VSAKTTSCGIIVTDGERMLLGHATRSPRWDIPKGEAEPGESLAAAACRELFEETGIETPEAELRPLGVFPYRSGKDLALFAWALPQLPDPRSLVCASQFSWNGRMWPEFDRFGLFTSEEALARVGKSLAGLLAGISLESLCGASS
jgi:8-oxo-dGTP pyrophosphatase MutT (NUDIX family)